MAATPSLTHLLPSQQRFFRPTPVLRKLLLLKLLQDTPLQSQASLGKACGLTSALINRYIDSLRSDELIRVSPVNKRDMRYDLTVKGQELSGELLDAYSAEVARTYAFIRSLLAERLKGLIEGASRRVAVFGAGATGEILLMTLTQFPHAQVVALVDSDPKKMGTALLGHTVSPPACLSSVLPDVIFVASWGRKQQILDAISAMSLPDTVQVVTL